MRPLLRESSHLVCFSAPFGHVNILYVLVMQFPCDDDFINRVRCNDVSQNVTRAIWSFKGNVAKVGEVSIFDEQFASVCLVNYPRCVL